VDLVLQRERYTRADLPYRRGETVELLARESVDGLVDGSSDVERETTVIKDLPGSARPGTKLGEVVVKVDGERSGRARSWSAEATREASLWERVWYTASSLWN
jgi:serine-type D-Ala-D-Ala carboxypeptidase (penicillin-binding protein 5/6)